MLSAAALVFCDVFLVGTNVRVGARVGARVCTRVGARVGARRLSKCGLSVGNAVIGCAVGCTAVAVAGMTVLGLVAATGVLVAALVFVRASVALTFVGAGEVTRDLLVVGALPSAGSLVAAWTLGVVEDLSVAEALLVVAMVALLVVVAETLVVVGDAVVVIIFMPAPVVLVVIVVAMVVVVRGSVLSSSMSTSSTVVVVDVVVVDVVVVLAIPSGLLLLQYVACLVAVRVLPSVPFSHPARPSSSRSCQFSANVFSKPL